MIDPMSLPLICDEQDLIQSFRVSDGTGTGHLQLLSLLRIQLRNVPERSGDLLRQCCPSTTPCASGAVHIVSLSQSV